MIEPEYKNGIELEITDPQITWTQAFWHWIIEMLEIGKYAHKKKKNKE